MVKGSDIWICLVILALDIYAAVLGCEAEEAQNQVQNLKDGFRCEKPFNLGLLAAFLLLMAHMFTSLIGENSSNFTNEDNENASIAERLSIACYVFTWIFAVIAFSILITGVVFNSRLRTSFGSTNIHFLRNGSILCIFHALTAIAYSVTENRVFNFIN